MVQSGHEVDHEGPYHTHIITVIELNKLLMSVLAQTSLRMSHACFNHELH